MEIKVAGGKYKLLKRIGKGAFGEIYLGAGSKGEEVAIKLESALAKVPQLMNQYRVYKHLHAQASQDKGLPQVYFCGLQGEYNLMVLELLGANLDQLLQKLGRFSLKTLLQVADQLVRRVGFVHERGIVHQDLKPENFAMGLGKKSKKVMLIDFGLAKKYRHGGKHIPYSEGKSLCGTARYASINNHLGVQQTRRDDLQSLLYCFIHFLIAKLPWQGLKSESLEDKYKLIRVKKQNTAPEDLCKGLPKFLPDWLRRARLMRFEEQPQYDKLREDIRLAAESYDIKLDDVFDWDTK